MEKLECLFCNKKFPLDPFNSFCPQCHEPMLVSYPPKKRTFLLESHYPLKKFSDFLPLSRINPKLSLGEGNTPLTELGRLSKKLNLPFVYAKNETVNPTSSFKDRGTAVAIQKVISLGIKRIGTVSTGNMAASTAAYGARAGLKTFVLVKEGMSRESLISAGIYNPVVITVDGDYGQLFYDSLSLGRKYKIYYMNSVDPFRIEGYKVTGFEIFLQLESQAPQYIFVPVSSGGHLTGLMRAYIELKQAGFIHKLPTFVGVQAQGSSPIAKAYAAGWQKIKKFKKINTIAHAISNPYPPGGNLVLKMIRENKGLVLAVSDKEILVAQRILAQSEGIFCQPDSATTLAGLIKLAKKFQFKVKDKAVLVLTGSGLKNLKDLESTKINIHKTSLSNLGEKIGALLNR